MGRRPSRPVAQRRWVERSPARCEVGSRALEIANLCPPRSLGDAVRMAGESASLISAG